MDKIVEELITGLIQRIERLEQRIQKLEATKPYRKNTTRGPGKATEGQLNYIKGLEKDLGIQGEDYSMLSKQEAGNYIEKLLAEKNKRKNNQQEIKTSSDKGISKPNPKVSDAPHDLRDPHADTFESKPLSQEEIDERGEEALL